MAGLSRLAGLFAGAVALLLASRGMVQAAGPMPFRLATLDIERLFEEHPLHQALVEMVEEQAEFARKQEARHRKRLDDARQRLAKVEAGTREHKQLQAEIERLGLDEELSAGASELPIEGDQLFAQILREIHETTERYRSEHGISLILRRSSDEVNEADSPVVFGVLQRFVLYDQGLDITDAVLAELKQAAAVP